MPYAFDPLMADGQTWRDLFDIVIVSAAKPHFFSLPSPAYCIEDEDEYLLRPHVGPFEMGCAYVGGNAMAVESTLGVAGGELLYVGDHLFGDVHVSKATLRWRTALILREIEAEIAAASAFRDDEAATRGAHDPQGRTRGRAGPDQTRTCPPGAGRPQRRWHRARGSRLSTASSPTSTPRSVRSPTPHPRR